VLLAIPAYADPNWYVDPTEGSDANPGTQAKPWRTLSHALHHAQKHLIDQASGVASDKVKHEGGAAQLAQATLFLRAGSYGKLELRGENYRDLTLKAASGATARFKALRLVGVKNLTLKNLLVTASDSDAPEPQTLVRIDDDAAYGNSRGVTLSHCTIQSIDNAADWQPRDWREQARDGISIGADDITLAHNQIRNTRFAVQITGRGARVTHNVIDGFSADGLRILGDDGVYAYNVIKNAYKVDDNHDDAIQSWARQTAAGREAIKNITLRGNLILNHDKPTDPFRTTLQGIGCFQGPYHNWTIENNVIMTDHWHGITLYGARHCRIINNTLIDLNTTEPTPWIMVAHNDTGPRSRQVVVRNNLAPAFKITEGSKIKHDHNQRVTDPQRWFVDPKAHNVHLRSTSPAIDAGHAKQAPPIDRDRRSRPQGQAVDLGAYERPVDTD
jgi:parallel beta-helix repeat protein